jgi:hypothetical protein
MLKAGRYVGKFMKINIYLKKNCGKMVGIRISVERDPLKYMIR